MSRAPRVSLVMKVYNGEKYLREAIDSILCQTYEDFEFLIIDDGSRDTSAEIVRSYSDPRIRFLQNEKNLGLCETQNRVIDAARGEFLAVMDCDDISYPDRFATQVSFLENHPEVIMCGTCRNDLVEGQEYPYQEIRELTPETLKFSLFFGNFYFTHSSIMFRLKQYREEGIRYGDVPIAEDYGVITRMAAAHPVALIPKRLVAYRIYETSVSQRRAEQVQQGAARVRCNFVETTRLSREDKDYLRNYALSHWTDPDMEHFLQVMDRLAAEVGADIAPGGNGFEDAGAQVREYVLRCNRYSYSLWRQIKRSGYRKFFSLKGLTGWKIWAACILGYKRKS